MTESYNPYANALAERINGILKAEFIGYQNDIDLKIMNVLVKNSIHIYNEIRPHYSCHYKTPNQKHKQEKVKIKTYKTKTTSKHVFTGS
jgi:transposase InsO family protein